MPFTATTLISGTSAAWTDVLTTGVVLTQNVSGLAVDTAYHWRARVLYRPGNRLGQTSSRWLHIPWNGWSETDFRTPYEPVVAHFSGAPLVGAVPLTVTFVNTSTGAASFVWNFGDGQSSTLEAPIHVYTATPSATLRGQAGVYTVSLTASGATQDTLTRTAYINVNDGLARETVIRYTYDPVYRLTSATYSGAYTYTFGYGYDEVGNRTAMTKTITSTLVTTYTYDAANRLSVVGGQSSMVWDANGNLLQEGDTTYAYDFANRLISTTLSGANTQFGYNGDGIRLRQIAAGTLTTYTQDYAAPLPVVLQAKTGGNATQYIYSVGTRPLAEYEAATWEYLLSDPLGSVRQIANIDGNVTLLKSYEPYGSVLNSQGNAASVFGYAGEQTDAYIKLVFLRARYMQPRLGLFLSRDPWEGDALRPGSMNGWNYTEGNPVSHTDPSGMGIGVACIWPNHWEEVTEDTPGGATLRYRRCVGPGGSSGSVALLTTMPAADPASAVVKIVKIVVEGGALVCYLLIEQLTQPRTLTIEEFYNLPQPRPTPFVPPVRDDPKPDETRMSYRGLDGDKSSDGTYFKKPLYSPSQFRLHPDGVSTFELPSLPGNKPYAIGFGIKVKTPILPGSTGEISGLACTATYTPQFGPGHWSINCIPRDQTPQILSDYAKKAKQTILNPNWTGQPSDRRLP